MLNCIRATDLWQGEIDDASNRTETDRQAQTGQTVCQTLCPVIPTGTRRGGRPELSGGALSSWSHMTTVPLDIRHAHVKAWKSNVKTSIQSKPVITDHPVALWAWERSPLPDPIWLVTEKQEQLERKTRFSFMSNVKHYHVRYQVRSAHEDALEPLGE